MQLNLDNELNRKQFFWPKVLNPSLKNSKWQTYYRGQIYNQIKNNTKEKLSKTEENPKKIITYQILNKEHKTHNKIKH